jgi:hypothetical protein
VADAATWVLAAEKTPTNRPHRPAAGSTPSLPRSIRRSFRQGCPPRRPKGKARSWAPQERRSKLRAAFLAAFRGGPDLSQWPAQSHGQSINEHPPRAGCYQRSAASSPALKRDRRHWRAAACLTGGLQLPARVALRRHQSPTIQTGQPKASRPSKAPGSPPRRRIPDAHKAAQGMPRFVQCSKCISVTGVFPMLCIGQMEPFQPVPQGQTPDCRHTARHRPSVSRRFPYARITTRRSARAKVLATHNGVANSLGSEALSPCEAHNPHKEGIQEAYPTRQPPHHIDSEFRLLRLPNENWGYSPVSPFSPNHNPCNGTSSTRSV